VANEADLLRSYPQGVDFDSEGFPIFDRYILTDDLGNPYIFQLDEGRLLGGNSYDMVRAESKLNPLFDAGNPASRLDNRLNAMWHHLQDGRTLILVPFNLHDFVKHTGGEAIVRHWNDGLMDKPIRKRLIRVG
jgi:hypothetical protein